MGKQNGVDLNPTFAVTVRSDSATLPAPGPGSSMGTVTGRTSATFGGLHLFVVVVVLPSWVTFISLNLNFLVFIKTEIMGLRSVHKVFVLASMKTQV